MEKIKKTKKEKSDYKTNKKDEEEINQISIKLKEEKEKNKILKEQNENLLKDIITIKNNIKSLIPSLPQSRLYPFPPLDELIAHIINFINIDSYKLYKHLHYKNQFPTEIIIIHFKEIFKKSQELIINHFSNVDNILNNKFKNIELITPLKAILKNAYQVNWKDIFNKLTNESNFNSFFQEIKEFLYEKSKQSLKYIIGYSSSFITLLKEYIKNTIELFLKCYICEPEIKVDLTKIGKLQKFNSVINESFINEKIENGEDCYILIPSFYYVVNNTKKCEIINKDKAIRNIDNIYNKNENNYNSINKNISKININNSKIDNKYFRNNQIKHGNLSPNNNKISYIEKRNYENEFYDRKKYSEIYFNSKSYVNRNVNYYNFSTNNHLSNNHNSKNTHYNKNNKRNMKDNYNYRNIDDKKRKQIYSDDIE